LILDLQNARKGARRKEMPTNTECKNIVLSSAKKVLIAPYGSTKEQATDIGFTSGNVTITGAVEKALIMVDQSATPIREIVTAVNLNLSIPLASVTLDNLAIALQVELDADGKADFLKEKYYSVWVETEGPVVDTTPSTRTFEFEKVSFAGTGELALSRTDMQNPTLEGKLIHCPDPDYPNYIGIKITEESEESGN
jgi:hypothetical protein